MRAFEKIIPFEQLAAWRASLPENSRPLVATNGCFDLLHPGHVSLLERARSLGKTLLVGLTSDAAIRALKGIGRPALPERDRLLMLCGLEAVSHVCLFPDLDACGFLEKARPDIYVKGGDYTLETLNQAERFLLERAGARIEILPRFENQSTTEILRRVAASASVRA